MTNADGSPPANTPAPEPTAPIKPRWGEMAPTTPVNPEAAAPAAPTFTPPPGYSPAPTAPYGQQPPYGQQVPYGQQTPYGQQPPYGQQAPYGQQGYAAYPGQYPGAPRPRTADFTITIILLALGLFGSLIGILGGAGLIEGLRAQYLTYGIPFTVPNGIGGLQAIIIVSQLVLFLAAVGISIPLLRKRRVAFWVPLVAGIVAAIFFWGILVGVLMSDPTLLHAVTAARNGAGLN